MLGIGPLELLIFAGMLGLMAMVAVTVVGCVLWQASKKRRPDE